MSARGRRIVGDVLVVLASVALVLALLAAYARLAAVDADQFANRATAALRDDSVRALVAEQITDEVVRREADLLAARPIIESVASGIVAGRAFTGLFRSAVRDVHRAVFGRDEQTVTLTVADVGTVLAAALERLRPSLARRVDASGRVALLRGDADALAAAPTRIAGQVRLLAVLLPALWLTLVAAALAFSPDRRRTVVRLGMGAALAGVALIVGYGVARSLAVGRIEGAEARAAARAVWDAFLGDLRGAAWIVAGSGAVVAAAAASLLRPVDLGEPLRRAAVLLAREPRRPALRVVRGLGLVTAGIAVMLDPGAVVRLVATLVGVYLVYEGVSALLRLAYRPGPAGAPAAAPGETPPAARARRRLVTPLIAAGVIAVAVAAFVTTGGTTTAAPAPGPCNGHDALCDRPFDRVALAATHNSMSVPLPGWFSAEHERPIADQLRDGIHGLLIDTHYGDRLANGRVRTSFGSREDLRRQAERDGVDRSAVDAALRIRSRAGFSGRGTRGMYLCHSFCELGFTPLDAVLDDLHDFLVANPGEVVVVINQDAVAPEDFVAAVRRAGLERLAYRGPVRGEWPTLREMIDNDQRVVFLAENEAGAAPWYRPAYDGITEETPYHFARAVQLTSSSRRADSCRPNRGREGSPLFLLNHWITTAPVPRPSDAAKVNAYGPLLARARDCARVRGHRMNLVAVNFYRRGDLFRVVDELNGVR